MTTEAAASRPSRFENIDFVRGIAAFVVLIQHSLEHAGFLATEAPGFGLDTFNLGQVGVAAFFLVSGFVIPLSLERWNDLGRFWFSRVCRIYPLYLFVFAVSCIAVQKGYEPSSVLAHLFFIQDYVGITNMVGNSWTLSLEMVWYCMFSAFFLLGLNTRSRVIATLTVGLLAAGILLTVLGGFKIPMGRVGLVGTCVFGLFSYRVSRREQTRENIACMIVVGGAIALGLYVRFGLYPDGSPGSPSIRCVATSWSVGYLLFGASFLGGRPLALTPLIRFLSRVSYSVYLTQTLAFGVLYSMNLSGITYVVLAIAITLVISTLTYEFIEAPGIRLSHRYASSQKSVSPLSRESVSH